VKPVQQSFDPRDERCGLREGAEEEQSLMETDKGFGVAEVVTGELIEQDSCFCSSASAEAALSGFEAGEQRVEGGRHVNSGWSV
jgi:hypothetical protein